VRGNRRKRKRKGEGEKLDWKIKSASERQIGGKKGKKEKRRSENVGGRVT
jgi:hypothetical protein